MRGITLTVLLLVLAATAAAQSLLYSGSLRGFHTSVGPRMIVRDKAGNLFTLYRDRLNPPSTEWRLGIAQSTDGGKNWNLLWQTGFDSNPAGEYGNVPGSLAIDSQENLHVTWCHNKVNYRSSDIRYVRWDKATKTWSQEVQMVANGYGRTTSALAVDSKDYVWMVHSTSSSWRCIMSRSDKPFASDLKFTPTNPAFSSSNCQHTALVVDALDRIHVSFYATSNGATVHHMWMDPGAASPKWSTAAPMGNNNAQADYYSSMAADGLGNVYIVYGVDVQSTKTADPYWELRKWDGQTQTWSNPVPIYKTTRAQYKPGGKDNDGRVIGLACDESTGEVYFTYRDFDTGQFFLGRWHDKDAAPTTYAKLTTTGTLPPNSLNYMIYPNFRGTLYPAFNRTSIGLDLIYCVGDQTATTPNYRFWYEPFPIGSLMSVGIPTIGTAYPLDLTALKDGGKAYVLAFSLTGLQPGLPIDRRFIPLVPDNLFITTAANKLPSIFQNFSGFLTASGTARATFNIPSVPALVSLPVYAAFATYPGGPSGVNVISNPFTFTISK